MKSAEKMLRRVIEGFGVVGALFLAAMMVLVVADVLLRFLLDAPILGSAEIIVVLMVCLVFPGLGATALRGEHISVDLISGKLSKRARAVLDTINYVLVFGYSFFIVTQSFKQAMFLKKMQMKSQTIGLIQWPFVLVVTFGTILLMIALLILLYNVRKDSEAETGPKEFF